MELERECTYKIVTQIAGKKQELLCDPKNGCLKNLVWSGKGIKQVIKDQLSLTGSPSIEAYVEGNCSELKQI